MIGFILFVAGLLCLYSYVQKEEKNNKWLMVFVITTLLVFLSYCKYTNFAINNLNRFLHMAVESKELIVPVGVSFITFEAISYVVDIHNGERKGSFLEILLFLSFFCKVTSGPIVSWKRFHTQIQSRSINLADVTEGSRMFIVGLAEKVIVADILGQTVYDILLRFSEHTVDAFSAVLCGLCYMVQIYYDFSGYSNMAIGMSRMFGFVFDRNFNEPYRSLSISEFWRRWHISLGTWFREYIYIPLGGNRDHVYRNLFIVFLLTGLWHGHGAGWNFILWGAMNGLLVVMERKNRDKQWYLQIPSVFKHLFVLIFVYFSWILFSFDSLGEVRRFIGVILGRNSHQFVNFTWKYYFTRRVIVLLIFAFCNDLLIRESIKKRITTWMNDHEVLQYGLSVLLLIAAVIWMVNSTYNPFIYYKF